MFFVDKSGAQWQIDEGLRERAGMLIDSFPQWLGHVELDQVMFLRLVGSKSSFHGKCFALHKAPLTLIPKFVVMKLQEFGLLKLDGLSDIGLDIFDIRYAIVVNEDSISQQDGDLQKIEDSTLIHEMMHIHPDGVKLVKHDCEDFKVLIQEFGPYWDEGIFKDPQHEANVQFEEGFAELEQKLHNTVDAMLAGPVVNTPPPPPFRPVSGTTTKNFDVESSD